MKKMFRRIGIVGVFLCSFDMSENTMNKESEVNEKDN